MSFFDCSICLTSLPSSSSLILPSCSHFFCSPCLVSFLKDKIMSGQTNSLCCPQCGKKIEPDFIKKNLDKKIYEKFLDFSIRSFEGSKKDEKNATCPKCSIPYCLQKDADYFTCPVCKIKYCAYCLGTYPSHSSLTCQEYEEEKMDEGEKKLRADLKEKGNMFCPYCRFSVEKVDGCNFMRCLSSFCKGNKAFCYLCGEKMEKTAFSGYRDHYFEQNVFGKMCQGLERNRKLYEMKKQKGELDSDSDEEEKEKYMCPGCKVVDRKVIEVLHNFNKKIGYCRSTQCNGLYYCFQCKKNFKVSNELDSISLLDHFENEECQKDPPKKEEINNNNNDKKEGCTLF